MGTKLCRAGELCNDTRHVQRDGAWSPCTCFYFRRRDEWFRLGGFPVALAGITADDAIQKSLITKRTAPELRQIARGFIDGKITKPLLIETGHPNSPVPIACYLAYQVALKFRVILVTIADLIEEKFERDTPANETRKTPLVRDNETAVFLRLGTDQRHAYAGATLQQLVTTRAEHGSPTVIMIDRPLDHVEGIYTAIGVGVLRTTCVRY